VDIHPETFVAAPRLLFDQKTGFSRNFLAYPYCMKVLVFSSDTALFYKQDGAWTPKPADAFDFEDTRQAARFCQDKELPNARIVLEFDDGQPPVTVPAALIHQPTDQA